MKNHLFIVLLLVGFISQAQNSDTTYWRKGGFISLTFSNVSLTNWTAGGQNSIAGNGNLSLFANRVKGQGKWENSLDLGYGLVKQADLGVGKSNDIINLTTKFSYRIKPDNDHWFYNGLIDFRTQFYEGFDEEGKFISDFMSPGYVVISLGVSYDPGDNWSFSFQPISDKWTFVTDQDLANEGAYGVDPAIYNADSSAIITPGKNFRSELGAFTRIKFKNDNFESKLELFTNYKNGTTDVNWQNALTLQLTKILSANIFTQLIYDKDIDIEADDNNDGVIQDSEVKPRVQFKSVLGLGLTYQFGATRNQ